MKKTLLLLLLSVITFYSCETPNFEPETTANGINTLTNRTIGDSTRTFNLKIEENSYEYDGWEFGLGVKVPPYDNGTYRISYSPKVFNGTEYDTIVTYNCPIANISPLDYSGQNDWVVNKEESGLAIGNGNYNYPGLLSITTFKNGLPIAQVIKQTFALSATAYKVGYNPLLQINYNQPFLPQSPFMFLPAQTADNYTNRAVVRSGKQIVVILLNPDGLVPETNINDNKAILPLNVSITSTNTGFLGTAVVDESAKLENQTHPPTNIVVTRRVDKGKRIVKLDWDCPYHEPFYVKHWFTVKRNGVVKYDGNDLSEFEDKTIQGNPQTITYTITTTVDGLGESTPVTRIVTR